MAQTQIFPVMKVNTLLWIITIPMLSACAPKPQKIDFGHDACHGCLMTIVDQQHAAQLVTTKGKAYKFDSIECLLRSMKEDPQKKYAYVLVSDYDNPGTLIDAETATYIVSRAIPSPMGAYLSAFSSRGAAVALQKDPEDRVYDWTSLQQVFSNQ